MRSYNSGGLWIMVPALEAYSNDFDELKRMETKGLNKHYEFRVAKWSESLVVGGFFTFLTVTFEKSLHSVSLL